MPIKDDGSNLIFLVGSPRSGTTWLQKLIASHNKILTFQESELFTCFISPQINAWKRLIYYPSGRGGTGLPCYLTKEQFKKKLNKYSIDLLEEVSLQLKNGMLFLEKTPSHALCINDIEWLFPKCKFIHLIRNPLDTVASIMAASKTWGKNWAPNDPIRSSIMWKKHVAGVQKTISKDKKINIIEIKYENLLTETLFYLKKIFYFIGIDVSEETLNKYILDNSIENFKSGVHGTKIKRMGEFAKISGTVVNDPSEFIRRGVRGGLKRDLMWIEKLIIKLICHREMKIYKYS